MEHGQAHPVTEKGKAALDFPVPRSKKKKDYTVIFGCLIIIGDFFRTCSDVVAPLTGLVSPSKSLVWFLTFQVAFQLAKALLCITPILAAPNLPGVR